jgi:galactokinase
VDDKADESAANQSSAESARVDPGQVREAFEQTFGAAPRLFSAPGRVNLIGEHTDYNDGFVMPLAIERRTFVAAAARKDRRIRVRSLHVGETAEIDLAAVGQPQRGSWLDYVEGVARVLSARGSTLVGADLLIASDVPVGAGLSSSAALEVAVGVALLSLANAELDRVGLACAAQAAEHEYVGTRCGIMDQYIAALGQAAHALLIDCRSLDATPVSADLGDAALLVCDSRVKHELSSSEYNVRHAECERGVEIIARDLPDVRALRDVTAETLERYRETFPPTVYRRCRHVVSENARTLRAADALRDRDLALLGRLMSESHISLRDDYEVSCPELDSLVKLALDQPGVYGSRLTGAGFGGCTLTLLDASAVPDVTTALTAGLDQQFDRIPRIFPTVAGPGAVEH